MPAIAVSIFAVSVGRDSRKTDLCIPSFSIQPYVKGDWRLPMDERKTEEA